MVYLIEGAGVGTVYLSVPVSLSFIVTTKLIVSSIFEIMIYLMIYKLSIIDMCVRTKMLAKLLASNRLTDLSNNFIINKHRGH